jgi:hypothetical protein
VLKRALTQICVAPHLDVPVVSLDNGAAYMVSPMPMPPSLVLKNL